MAQDAAPMPVRSRTVPTVRAATLGPEQHGTVRPPAIDTMLGPLPGLSSLWQGASSALPPTVNLARPSLPCPGSSFLGQAVGRPVPPLQGGCPAPRASSWEGVWLGQLSPSLPTLLALKGLLLPNDTALCISCLDLSLLLTFPEVLGASWRL